LSSEEVETGGAGPGAAHPEYGGGGQFPHAYPLREAPRAHRDREARKTTGSLGLIP